MLARVIPVYKTRKRSHAGPNHPLIHTMTRQQPKFAAGFTSMVDAAKKQVKIGQLTAALADKDWNRVLQMLNLKDTLVQTAQGFGVLHGQISFRDALRQTFYAGMQVGMDVLDKFQVRKISIAGAMSFDDVNPEALEFLRDYEMDMITNVSQATQDAINAIVLRAFQEGGNPLDQAREIRSLIGLTPQQATAVDNFRRALESLDFDGALDRSLRDQRFDRTLIRAAGSGTGLSADQIDNQVERYASRTLNYRALTIARTETARAANQGQKNSWAQAVKQGFLDPSEMYQKVILGPDPCEICLQIADMNDEGVPVDEAFDVPDEATDDYMPFHPRCLPGDTHVFSTSDVTGYSARWYDGELVVLRTALGHYLRLTPNHPILTDHGWVAAGLLEKGGNVISSLLGERVVVGNDHNNHMPPTIEQVAQALWRSSQMRSCKVPIAPEDFHGDGAGSKVAVVGANRLLWHDRNTSIPKQAHKLGFPHVHLRAGLSDAGTKAQFLPGRDSASSRIVRGSNHGSSLFGGKPFPALLAPQTAFAAPLLAAPERMCSSYLRRPLFGGHLRPPSLFAFRGRATGNPLSFKEPQDSVNRDPNDFRNILGGVSAFVKTDCLLSVERRTFSGHVYNLQTELGWYVANGVITHNCFCVPGLVRVSANDDEEDDGEGE
jgi:hypothetical protein